MMKKLILASIGFLIFSCNNEDDPLPGTNPSWTFLGLDGRIVNQIKLAGNYAYLTTDQGFYRGDLSNEEPEWESLGFEEDHIQAALILNDSTFVISIINRQNIETPSLYKTTSGGEEWVDFQNGFGGEAVEEVNDLVRDPADPEVWYASGSTVVARSDNAGQSWTPIYGEWGGFSSGIDIVRVSPHDPKTIWAGGQNAIEEGYLIHSEDGGEEWKEYFNLVEAPSVAKELIFHPSDPSVVWAGFEGGLLRTSDNGGSWETAIDGSGDNRFFFGVARDPDDPSVLYAGGWLKRFNDPQPLIIYRSEDGGESWSPSEHSDVDFGGVMEITIFKSGQEKRILVGLYRGGIYEVHFD